MAPPETENPAALAGAHRGISKTIENETSTPPMPTRQAAWRARNPEKYRAHMKVAAAIRRGHLDLPNACEECGATGRLDRHHDSYEPRHVLRVRVFCRRCHVRWHVKRRKAGRK